VYLADARGAIWPYDGNAWSLESVTSGGQSPLGLRGAGGRIWAVGVNDTILMKGGP
jgi:hypothetical protein